MHSLEMYITNIILQIPLTNATYIFYAQRRAFMRLCCCPWGPNYVVQMGSHHLNFPNIPLMQI